MLGFEPRTFRAQGERAAQTAPHPVLLLSTDGRTRTSNLRLWRPLLYQLSYIRRSAAPGWPRRGEVCERLAGFEPAWTALQTAALPLGHNRLWSRRRASNSLLSGWKPDVHPVTPHRQGYFVAGGVP